MTELNIDFANFIDQYWQRQPVLLRGALVNFQDPICPEELAGLAAENFIESRVIFRDENQSDHIISDRESIWEAESGPFTDYQKYGDANWTLVVQAVNHWHAAAQTFAEQFYQLPMWQFDDVMVSFATKGGGVGPHRDRYDTFICQGSGKRRWRVGERDALIKDVIAHDKLLHVTAFDAHIDAVLKTGDILYIPAGFPHEGVSLGESISFSVGFQSINSTQLLSDFADYLIDQQKTYPPALYQHADRSPRTRSNALTTNDISGLQTFLKSAMSNDTLLNQFCGQYFSEARHDLDMPPIEEIAPIDSNTLLAKLEKTPLIKTLGLKCLHIAGQYHTLFINGEAYLLTNPNSDFVKLICGQSTITHADRKRIDSNLELVTTWVNLGFYYFA